MNPVKTSVVIPIYNEEKNLIRCLDTLSAYMSESFDDYEIIIVNDGSTDNTLQKAEAHAQSIPNLRLITYDDNQGKGNAVRMGMCASLGDAVIYTDCDLAYGVDVIGKMVNELEHCDVVIGSRNLTKEGHKGYNFIRKLASKTYIRLLNFAAGFDHTDSQCGIKCYAGAAARKVFSNCETKGFAFDLEALMIAEKAGYSVGEYPVSIINHSEEGSKVHIVKDTLKMLADIKRIKKHVKSLDLTKEN